MFYGISEELTNSIRDILLDVRMDYVKRGVSFTGKCNEASSTLKFRIADKFNSLYERIELVHGELAMKWFTPPRDWGEEHTWIEITFDNGDLLVIDPTCGQFMDIYPDIPEWYIGNERLIYFLPDKKNIRYSTKIGRKINEKFQFKIGRWQLGIIEIFQYYVLRNLCRIYRFIQL